MRLESSRSLKVRNSLQNLIVTIPEAPRLPMPTGLVWGGELRPFLCCKMARALLVLSTIPRMQFNICKDFHHVKGHQIFLLATLIWQYLNQYLEKYVSTPSKACSELCTF